MSTASDRPTPARLFFVGALTLLACDPGTSPVDGRVVGIDGGRACAAPGSVPVGWPCTCATDCADALDCWTEAAAGYAGGLCLAECATTEECGPGLACLTLPAPIMGVSGTCHPTCTSSADCPPGRSCSTVQGTTMCFPLCQSDSECDSGHCDPYTTTCTDGTPSTGLAILEDCTRDEECRSGHCSMLGACINRCSVERQGCPDGMICTGTPGDDFGFCGPPCTTNRDCESFPEALCEASIEPPSVGYCYHTEEDLSDPCVTGTFTSAIRDRVGCNGEPLGPSQPDNQFAGRCTEEPDSCVAPNFCVEGICYRPCTPLGFVTTSDCPSGSRCWRLGEDLGVCYPDCRSNADCASGTCDEDGSCV